MKAPASQRRTVVVCEGSGTVAPDQSRGFCCEGSGRQRSSAAVSLRLSLTVAVRSRRLPRRTAWMPRRKNVVVDEERADPGLKPALGRPGAALELTHPVSAHLVEFLMRGRQEAVEHGRKSGLRRSARSATAQSRSDAKGAAHSFGRRSNHSSPFALVIGSLATTTCGSCSVRGRPPTSRPPSGCARYLLSSALPPTLLQCREGGSRSGGCANLRARKCAPSEMARLSETQLRGVRPSRASQPAAGSQRDTSVEMVCSRACSSSEAW